MLIKKIIRYIKKVLSLGSRLKAAIRGLKIDIFFDFYNKKSSPELVIKKLREGKAQLRAVSPLYEANEQLKNSLGLKALIPLKNIEKTVPDFYLIWGISPERDFTEKIITTAAKNNKPCLIAEDGFIRSVTTWADKNCSDKLKIGVSFSLDDKSSYYDGRKRTLIEDMLQNTEVSPEEIQRSKRLIELIVKNYVTKYNHQPIFTPEIGEKDRKKVLVIDQSFGDYSIKKGLANEKTFENMLKAAIEENPDADILVKTHPDTMTGTRGGYYTGLKQEGRIYPVTFKINPISLINYVDKVYVVSSQFGFEALMCEKEVVCFGLPFYSNWGLTDDRIKCRRRNRKLSVEEVFAVTYLKYCFYTNPDTEKNCEIEEAIDYIIKQREEFFSAGNR